MWKESLEIVLRGTLESGTTAYPMQLQPVDSKNRRENALLFHFAMWLAANPTISNFRLVADGGVAENPVVELSGYTIWVLFGHRKDRTAFTKWLNRYRTWFSTDMDMNFFPELPDAGNLKISIVSTSFTRIDLFLEGKFPEGFVDRWSWIITHCKKPVYLMPNRGFAFTDLKEAVHYKLHFGVE